MTTNCSRGSPCFSWLANTGRAVLAIGNFDGCHRGHQALLRHARSLADRKGAMLTVLTFEPHPREFFRPHPPLFRLTPVATKTHLLQKLGVDDVRIAPFDAALAMLPADTFAREMIGKRLAPSAVVIGENFRFGHGRSGNSGHLLRAGQAHAFKIENHPLIRSTSSSPISSSRVREVLATGLPESAREILGFHWYLEGTVIPGDALARRLAMPTANLEVPSAAKVRHGVYAVFVVHGGIAAPGVASWGIRPHFNGKRVRLEVHILDANRNLYGERLRVCLVSYLRPERAFKDNSALARQMQRDAEQARQRLLGDNGRLDPTVLTPTDVAVHDLQDV